MSRFRIALITSIAAMAAASACGPATVKVTYSQVANFWQVDDHDPSQVGPVTSTTAGANGLWIMYRITKIENTSKQKFVFDSHKVVTVTPDKTSTDEDTVYPGQLETVTVNAGDTVTNPGCIVKKAGTNDPKSLSKTTALVDVLYQLDADPKATMSRKSGDTTTQIPAQSIVWPDKLMALCQGN